jgi:hypothetical protein
LIPLLVFIATQLASLAFFTLLTRREAQASPPWEVSPSAPTCQGIRVAEEDPPPLPLTCLECGYIASYVARDGSTPEGDPIWRVLPHPRADW